MTNSKINPATIGVLAALLTACTGDGKAESTATGSATDTLTSTSATGTSATGTMSSTSGTQTTDPSDSASSTGSSTTGTGTTTGVTTVVFDVGVPDVTESGTGGGVVGIPETCAEALMTQSTVGCSFHANKMQNFIEEPTSVIVGNVSQTMTASVQLYYGPGGVETAVGVPVNVLPGEAFEFVLNDPPQPGDVSVLRDGGAHRVESDVPIVAYQHSPISAQAHNDSSMLIPDHALGQFYIAAAYGANISSDPSMFNVVGIEDGTTVTWQPPNPTAAGTGVPAVNAGAMGMVTVDHYDMLQVVSSVDVSGTIIETSKPAWVVAAVPCVNIPAGVTFCDHIEEKLIPLEYWGSNYVGAHAPTRGTEDYIWRVYSAADMVTVTTDPPQGGTPVVLDRGEYYEFATQESFMFSADGPIMPVQYLVGQNGGAGTGDPASYQMVPVEQFLPRYVFITGTGYTENYAQVIRPLGGADVLVDGAAVTGYYTVGTHEVADWPIAEGAHLAESADPFGLIQVGYTGVTSYAYPGGLALGFINPNPEG